MAAKTTKTTKTEGVPESAAAAPACDREMMSPEKRDEALKRLARLREMESVARS